MDQLSDIVYYLLENYPHKGEMSKARFVKSLYLIDWKAAYDLDRQVTNIEWYFNHYGPYVPDIISSVKAFEGVEVKTTTNFFGEHKQVITLSDHPQPVLSSEIKVIVDSIIDYTKKMYWREFIDIVYATYPIRSNGRYNKLHLVSLARELKAQEGF